MLATACWICLTAALAPAATAATVRTAARCYRVGQPVTVFGAGFAASSPYDLAIDGIDFGQSTTTAGGAFTAQLTPGGLPAGTLETTDVLDATDGTAEAATTFTLTRPTGVLVGGTTTPSARAVAPLRLWDFSPRRRRVTVYVHYLRTGIAAATLPVGRTSGACGTLTTRARPLFPFTPGHGVWRLQFDTSPTYRSVPPGPSASLLVRA